MPLCADSQISSSHIAPMEAIWLEKIRPETVHVYTMSSCQYHDSMSIP